MGMFRRRKVRTVSYKLMKKMYFKKPRQFKKQFKKIKRNIKRKAVPFAKSVRSNVKVRKTLPKKSKARFTGILGKF